MEKQQSNNFDGLRLLGALLVLFSHQFALSGRPEPRLFDLKLGTIGVAIFFSISGFLVTSSWSRDPHLWRFALRRVLRVWPGLAACVVVTALFLVPVVVHSEHRAEIPGIVVGYLLPNLVFTWRDGIFFQHNPFPHINGSLWTIPIEVQCYVLLALVGVVARKRLRLGLIVLGAVALGADLAGFEAVGVLNDSAFFRPVASVFVPGFFLAGALMCAVPILRSSVGCLSAVVLGLLAAACGFPALAFGFALPALVVFVGTRSWLVLRAGAKWGDLSYGMYLWAWPVQQIGVWLLGASTPYFLLLAPTLAIVTLLSFVSWHLIEKRCLRLKPKSQAKVMVSGDGLAPCELDSGAVGLSLGGGSNEAAS